MPDFISRPENIKPKAPEAEVPKLTEDWFKVEKEASRETESASQNAGEQESPSSSGPGPATDDQVSELEDRVATPHTKSERLVEIEHIMSEGLEGIYVALDPQNQLRIKEAGEIAATKIEELIESGKAAAKKVLDILRAWLQKIPGVNAFFLEQESKIKTDRIMALAHKTYR